MVAISHGVLRQEGTSSSHCAVVVSNWRRGLVCAGLLAASLETRALDASNVLLFTWEPLTIKPQVDVAVVYNDNVSSRVNNKTEDLITTISPGVEFLLGKRTGNNIVLNYTLSQHFYADRTDLDSTEHSISLNSFIEGERLSLQGTDRIQFLSSPIGSETRIEELETGDRVVTGIEQNIDRITFYDVYRLNYSISPKTAVYVQGQHSAYEYEEGVRLFDVRTLAGTVGGGYKATEKTVIFGEGYYGITSSSANVTLPNIPSDFPDLTFMGGAIGVRGTFTPKITGTVRVGYETREFDDNTGSSSSPVVNLGLSYQYSAKTSMSLNYTRRQDVSVQFAQQSYTADVINAQIAQLLGTKGKWRLTAGGYYGFYDYEASQFSFARNYDIYSLNFGVAYQIQLWLSASLGFDRTSVSAKTAGSSSYDINRVTFRLAVGY